MELEKYIRNRLTQKQICIMTHVIAGYPSFDDNLRALEIMAQNNVDVVEIQMPFSEPIADGPVFVYANQESLKRGTTVESYFDFMKQATSQFDFPLLMMGYYNTVFKMGDNIFLDRLKNSGGKGFIIPDLPVEEGELLFQKTKEQSLSPIQLVTPTTQVERMQKIDKAGSGFIYVVARKGVTGKKTSLSDSFDLYLEQCRQSIELPLAVGFGISNKADLDFLTGKVEIAIIGTALLKAWELDGEKGLREFFKLMRSGIS
ncbi:tryptophan synthase subunit alpha [candidate division KSB1 bacterium]|nr:tryptophan synthase subunit alpha [candidate division KSB1 bacterium]